MPEDINVSMFEQARQRLYENARLGLTKAIERLKKEMSEDCLATYQTPLRQNLGELILRNAEFQNEAFGKIQQELGVPKESCEVKYAECNDRKWRHVLLIELS